MNWLAKSSRSCWLALALVLNSSGTAALAADYFWNVANGAFQTDANWNPVGTPGDFDNAFINNGGTANLSILYEPVPPLVGVAATVGSTGTLNVTAGGDLLADKIQIGERGNGIATVNDGKLAAREGSLFVGGENETGTGVLNVTGANASVASDDDIQFGRVGTGTLNMQGGRMTGGYTVVGKFGTGIWNHSGGLFDQDFGDIEIGDGGRPDQSGTSGPRTGTINLSGGVIQSAGYLAIGNRVGGGSVNISGGALVMTGVNDGSIVVGRGMDWAASPGAGGATSLKVTGDDSLIIANGNLAMNPDGVASSSTLIEEITGPTQTTIKVTGDANLVKGALKVVLNGYTPASGDSWTLIQAGADLTADKAAVDAIVAAGGFPPLTHVDPLMTGTVIGPFASTDFSLAPLASGLSWNVSYVSNSVVLSVTGTAAGVPGDFNGDHVVDAADYTVWRDHLNSNVALPNDNGLGTPIGAAHYDLWKSNFGDSGSGGGSLGASAVPEPTSAVLWVACPIIATFVARSISRKHRWNRRA